ncbi:MAG: hypothetical protein AB1896_10065 [Thermodesulfobacteriota bacterium]
MAGLFRTALACLLVLPLLGVPAAGAQETDVTGRVQAARTVGVPDPVLARLTALGLEHRLEPAEVVGLLDVVTAARREEAPVDPLLAKVEEGLAKRVPAARIQEVLRRKLDDYRFARRVAGEIMRPKDGRKMIRPEELAALSDALDLGLTREELSSFLAGAPAAPREMLLLAVENKALLKQAGFQAGLVDQILYAGLEKERLTSSWRYLSRVLAAARRRGVPESQAAAATLAVIEEGGDVEELMARLGFTARDFREGP